MNYGLLPVAKCLVAGPARTLDNKIEPTESRLNFIGGVGAINLEQLDVLLNSLKTYWDYTKQKSFLDEIKAPATIVKRTENELTYEL